MKDMSKDLNISVYRIAVLPMAALKKVGVSKMKKLEQRNVVTDHVPLARIIIRIQACLSVLFLR